MSEKSESEKKNQPYRVLARKYRPTNFDELIGQEALVRTLKNAIESGRIAHAYMLTGIRGTGKTTTARIIAKALNYTGPDGKGEPTAGPTDDCEVCRAITEDRHPDVLEMDAASRTGVGDIREIIDGVRYAPTGARYKVYIIDEVHMLSTNAFNALLKTLEEPPAHVIFIFATTEIRKVPVTVLSRCQRFDLRRVDVAELSAHYKKICDLENVKIEDEALTMIARAAGGSVRDGLSLLDQAIALSSDGITAELVKDMLGLADSGNVLAMLEHALKGECAAALDIMADFHKKGADPAVIVRDMLDFIHLMTKMRAVKDYKDTIGAYAGDILDQASALSAQLSMPTLGRAWQIILKGLDEVNAAPNPQAAAEMLMIRLVYAANLPDPAELLRKLTKEGATSTAAGAEMPVTPAGQAREMAMAGQPEGSPDRVVSQSALPSKQVQARTGNNNVGGSAATALAVAGDAYASPEEVPEVVTIENINTLQDVVALLEQQREMILASNVRLFVRLVKMVPGRIEICLAEGADQKLANDMRAALIKATGAQWMVVLSTDVQAAAPTLAAQKDEYDAALLVKARALPVAKKVLSLYPEAEIRVTEPESKI